MGPPIKIQKSECRTMNEEQKVLRYYFIHHSSFIVYRYCISSTTHLSRTHRNFIAGTRPDLVQFDHIAEWILHEDLVRVDTDESFDLPVPDATIFEFFFRF